MRINCDNIFFLNFSWTNVILGVVSTLLFMPGVFVEHNMAAKEWKQMKSDVGSDVKMPSPKLYAIILMMVVCFLTRVNITINER